MQQFMGTRNFQRISIYTYLSDISRAEWIVIQLCFRMQYVLPEGDIQPMFEKLHGQFGEIV